MKRRILNLLIALDSFVLVLLTLGKAWPGETISSAAYRAELKGGHFCHARPVIDWLFSPIQKNHCFESWLYATNKGNLPEDMRGQTHFD